MITICVLYLLIVAISIVTLMLVDAVRGNEELLSLRNFFLFGFLIFQVTGGAYVLSQGSVGEFVPSDLPAAAGAYCAKMTLFILIFLVAGKVATKPLDRVYYARRKGNFRAAPFSLLIIALATIPLALLSQFVLVRVPIIGPGMKHLGFGMYAVGAGLAAWVAAPRLKNPAILFPAAGVVLFCMAMTFYQNFGRRDLLGVVVAVMWAAYYARWRSLSTGKLLLRLGVIGAAGTVLLFAFTSVRSGEFNKRGMIENIMSLRDAKISDGFADVLSGQAASMASMWLIESRPVDHEYDTLHSARVLVTMPIPRALWPQKPVALALSMPQTERHIPGKPDFYNIGPGIIGHVENDNPWIAMWLYPIFLAVMIRTLDRGCAWFADNPFIVLPMGAAIGQFIGIPRGELGTFVFIAIVNITGAFVIMQAIAIVLRTFGIIRLDPEQTHDDPHEDWGEEYDEAHA